MHSELIELAINEDNKEFWDYISKGDFRMQQCSSCNEFRYPPSRICPNCSSEQYLWEAISGKGEVFTWTILNKAYHPFYENKVPYNIAVIKLDEGVHFLSNVECDPKQLKIGMRVKAVLRDLENQQKLPQFIPAGG